MTVIFNSLFTVWKYSSWVKSLQALEGIMTDWFYFLKLCHLHQFVMWTDAWAGEYDSFYTGHTPISHNINYLMWSICAKWQPVGNSNMFSLSALVQKHNATVQVLLLSHPCSHYVCSFSAILPLFMTVNWEIYTIHSPEAHTIQVGPWNVAADWLIKKENPIYA